MPAARRRLPPAIGSTLRDQVENIHHKEIDNLLKDLRSCSRRLKVAMDSFTDELRILERLYYKSKNQHRMALSFKRVVEIRRYGQRLEELNILECVDLLRASFVGLEGTKDRKALKGSWSHVPQKSYVNYVIERLTSCSTLVCKMRERLERGYHHFSLAMQSGAFIQLIILFAAICSRMSSLLSEIRDSLQSSASTCTRLFLILHVSSPSAVQRYLDTTSPFAPQPTNKLMTTVVPSMPNPSAEQVSRSSQVYIDQPTKEVGQPISHFDHMDTLGSVPLSFQAEETALRMHITPPPPPCLLNSVASAINHTTTQVSEQASAKVIRKPRLKRAKKRRDEIDEIFGF